MPVTILSHPGHGGQLDLYFLEDVLSLIREVASEVTSGDTQSVTG